MPRRRRNSTLGDQLSRDFRVKEEAFAESIATAKTLQRVRGST
jgi:hypothetical protein